MSNWAEDMLNSIEQDIRGLELQEETVVDELKKRQISSMKSGLQKQCLDLYRHAIKEGTLFDLERLKRYESYHQIKKLYLSDPQLEERNLSSLMRIKSAEEEMFNQMEHVEDTKKPNNISIDLSFLSKRQQETIQLYADGLTYTDIGELIGVKKGTVSKHLQLARSRAREFCSVNKQLELKVGNAEDLDKPTKRKVKKFIQQEGKKANQTNPTT